MTPGLRVRGCEDGTARVWVPTGPQGAPGGGGEVALRAQGGGAGTWDGGEKGGRGRSRMEAASQQAEAAPGGAGTPHSCPAGGMHLALSTRCLVLEKPSHSDNPNMPAETQRSGWTEEEGSLCYLHPPSLSGASKSTVITPDRGGGGWVGGNTDTHDV